MFWRKRPAFDPALGDPVARAVIDAATRGDGPALRKLLDPVTDPDARAFYLGCCSDVGGVQEWVDNWIADEPDSTVPLLVKGVHGVSWAWEARGGAYASATSQDRFKEFFRRLKMAEDCLDAVVERDPDDTTAWATLVTSARGRQVGMEETERRFAQVVSRHPAHRIAHEQMLQTVCAKWSGSREQMFAFARNAPLPHLIALAYIEDWLADEVIDTEDARAELRAAAARAGRAGGVDPGAAVVHNAFAMALCLASDGRAATEQFALMGDRVTEFPWYYTTKPVKTFRKQAAKG